MKKYFKNQNGFIQIPILIAIIIGVIAVGGASYFGIKKYQNYQSEKIEKEKEVQALAKAQQKSLEEAKLEIEKLKLESEQAEQKQAELEQKISDESAKPKDIIIQSSDIATYLTGVGEIFCGGEARGSGSLWQINNGYSVLTNNHVIQGATSCIFSVDDAPNDIKHSGVYKLDMVSVYNWNDYTDAAVIQLGSPTDVIYFPPAAKLNYGIYNLSKCSKAMGIGSPVRIIVYPAFAEQSIEIEGYKSSISSRTITDGIISAYDNSARKPIGDLLYSNYFVSAKIDSGNSGGIALSKDENGLCVLGIPTWLSIGNYETQGIVQNIHNVMYIK